MRCLASIDCQEIERSGLLALGHFGQSEHRKMRGSLGVRLTHHDPQYEVESAGILQTVFFPELLVRLSLRRYATEKQ